MFGNVQNNNSNADKSVNTRIATLYGDISSLQLTYWNDKLSIKINPLQSISPEGLRQYDYTRRATTAITQEKCLALVNDIEKNIIPKIESGESLTDNINVGVAVGTKGTAVYVEYKNDDKGIPSTYLTMYTNIDPTTNKAPTEGIYSYKFTKTQVSVGYDSETGESKGTKAVESEFMFFFDKLKTMPQICGTAAQSINMDNMNKSAPKNNYNSSYSNTQSQVNNSYSAPVSDFSGEFPL